MRKDVKGLADQCMCPNLQFIHAINICPVQLPSLEAMVAGVCQSNQWLLLEAEQEDCRLNK